jgi:hypothetical protein
VTFASLPTVGAGAKLTASYLASIKANFDELGDAWTAYTPVVTGTGWVAGNATLIGGWIEINNWVEGRFTITIGSTTTVGTGAYSITLPKTSAVTNINAGGGLTVFDTSAPATRQRHMYINTSTTVAAQDDSGTFVSGTAPFALATGDTLKGKFSYQAA